MHSPYGLLKLLLVFEKFTHAYLFQIALEIMWLPILRLIIIVIIIIIIVIIITIIIIIIILSVPDPTESAPNIFFLP